MARGHTHPRAAVLHPLTVLHPVAVLHPLTVLHTSCQVADAIMRVYSTRTSGSFVQRKGASIVWNHQHADPEFGTMQARELQYHLQGVLAAFAVVVRAGKGYVEACPKGINKGVMAERIIELEQADDARPYPPLFTCPLSSHLLRSLPPHHRRRNAEGCFHLPYYNPIFPDSRLYLCSPNPPPLTPLTIQSRAGRYACGAAAEPGPPRQPIEPESEPARERLGRGAARFRPLHRR